jgi:hypothetical protein
VFVKFISRKFGKSPARALSTTTLKVAALGKRGVDKSNMVTWGSSHGAFGDLTTHSLHDQRVQIRMIQKLELAETRKVSSRFH